MEHVIILALSVNADSRKEAEEWLHKNLPPTISKHDVEGNRLESWWVAEDERYDGSDNDSAVFVKPGHQREAVRVLQKSGDAY